MGLMYVFPVSNDETDFVLRDGDKITLKSYGLPYIFWFYAFCAVAMVFFMFLAIQAPVLKLIELGDDTDATLGYSLLTILGISPLVIFSFFFFEKRLVREGNKLSMEYRLAGLKFFSETFLLENDDELVVESFLDSPNVARMKNTPEATGFQNKGYFVLWLKSKEGRKILIDRHSRKVDLEKLRQLLLQK